MKNVLIVLLVFLTVATTLTADAEDRQKVIDKYNEYWREEAKKLEELGRWCLKNGMRPVGYRVLEQAMELRADKDVRKLLNDRDLKEDPPVAPVEVQKEYLAKRSRMGEVMCKKWAKVVGWARKYKVDKHGESARKAFYRNIARTIGVLYTDPADAAKQDAARDFLEITIAGNLEGALKTIEDLAGIGHEPSSGLLFHVLPGDAVDGKFVFRTEAPDRIEVFLGNWAKRSPDDGPLLVDAVCRAVAHQSTGADQWKALPLWFRAGLGGLCTGRGKADFARALQAADGRVETLLDGLDSEQDDVESLTTRAEAHLVFELIEKRLSDSGFRNFMNEALTTKGGVDKALQKAGLPRGEDLEKAVYKRARGLYGLKR